MINDEPSIKELARLWVLCENFIKDQRIHSGEDVYQTDRVIENAYQFMHDICKIVGFVDYEEEDD